MAKGETEANVRRVVYQWLAERAEQFERVAVDAAGFDLRVELQARGTKTVATFGLVELQAVGWPDGADGAIRRGLDKAAEVLALAGEWLFPIHVGVGDAVPNGVMADGTFEAGGHYTEKLQRAAVDEVAKVEAESMAMFDAVVLAPPPTVAEMDAIAHRAHERVTAIEAHDRTTDLRPVVNVPYPTHPITGEADTRPRCGWDPPTDDYDYCDRLAVVRIVHDIRCHDCGAIQDDETLLACADHAEELTREGDVVTRLDGSAP